MSIQEDSAVQQAINALDETVTSAQQIRVAMLARRWTDAFKLVVEFGINATQAVALVSAASTTAAGLEAMRAKRERGPS